jgi:hypothetical protein
MTRTIFVRGSIAIFATRIATGAFGQICGLQRGPPASAAGQNPCAGGTCDVRALSGNRCTRAFRWVRLRSATWRARWRLRRAGFRSTPSRCKISRKFGGRLSVAGNGRLNSGAAKSFTISRTTGAAAFDHRRAIATLPFLALSTSDRDGPAYPSSGGADHRYCRLRAAAPQPFRALRSPSLPSAAARTA